MTGAFSGRIFEEARGFNYWRICWLRFAPQAVAREIDVTFSLSQASNLPYGINRKHSFNIAPALMARSIQTCA
jgi:hypothetical protein